MDRHGATNKRKYF
jgi:hypothetical protein